MNKLPRYFGFASCLALTLAIAVPARAVERLHLAQEQNADPMLGTADGEDSGDPSAAVLRLGRLENQIRTLTGQIEELQHQNKRLEDNMRKLQEDTDFRFQDLQGRPGGAPALRPALPQKRSEADAPGAAPDAPVAALVPPAASPAPPKPTRSGGDAFDPAADPTAPGAPRSLGTTAPSAPLTGRSGGRIASEEPRSGPLDLMQRTPGAPVGSTGGPTVIAAPPAAMRDLPNPDAVASLVPGGTREEYDADLGLYKQGQFDGAASGFQSFAQKYPKDRLVPDAVYLAGESFARLGRHREAAEQFLKVSTDYGKSPRAPDALLRLGMSLNALGAKEQACATYQEVTRRYPAASSDVRSAVDRELKRARCLGSG